MKQSRSDKEKPRLLKKLQRGPESYFGLRGLPCEIVMHNVGTVNSSGLMVFCAGEKRYATRNSSFMFHGVTWTTPNPLQTFDEKFLANTLDSIAGSQELLSGILAERTGIPPERIKDMIFRQVTRTPQYALENGLICEIKEFVVPANCHLVRGDSAFP